MRPKLGLPTRASGPLANRSWLNAFSISTRSCPEKRPLIGTRLVIVMSQFDRNGVRMRGSVRGAFPNVNGAAPV